MCSVLNSLILRAVDASVDAGARTANARTVLTVCGLEMRGPRAIPSRTRIRIGLDYS